MLVIHFSITRDNHNFTESTDANVVELVNNLINYVNSIFNIDLRVLNFQEQFTIHIQRLIERSSQGFVERNPMTSTIRKSSPMIYECAVLIANQLEERTHLKIADDEIAYIAMHIGNAVSEYIKDLHKLFVVVLIPEYQNSDNELVSRLERLFNQDVVVGRIVHSTEDLQSDKLPRKIDFVIQVNSIETIAEFRHTNISQFLTQSDYQRVNTMIQTIKREKESTNFIENLRRFFPEENFKILRGINNRDAVLRSVTDHLYKRGVVTENFYEQLLKRESMSSTAFGHIAIPHSLRMTAKKTEGFVIVAPRGIHWDNNTTLVNLVFLLAIQKNNNSAYRNIFDDISQIMIEPKNIAMLVQAKNYRDFVKILTSLQ
ncbi:BglG family transcription antiterminator [Lacticaseibacillus pantheris]|uniref:BglG family transcription antiterminator n=1 Tax=Lacticaseibacillus pantheris TaxID=171523 RepID=UPI002657E61B|nr:PTS sugar transporter subunit IIA [Lacticaseibacillus pantheris]WKF86155.1 PTS sugar transporter subunit IIA [Lacticaseibacillus pantheris]